LQPAASADAALVAPAPPHFHIQKISDADTELILNRSRPDTNWISSASELIHDRSQLHRKEIFMSKLKLVHGVSWIRRAKLQSSIDQTVADDVELLAEWSNNETNYVVNELLRFALTQEEDFLKYKAGLCISPSQPSNGVKPVSVQARPAPTASTKTDSTTASQS
jgi:hypothetical protein